MNTQTTEKQQLIKKQETELKALQTKHNLQNKFVALTGFAPSIICPENKPFAVFKPETKADYLAIIEALQPSGENFTLTFSGQKDIPTFSPYSIHYGGKHSNPAYMDVTVKFKHSICPVWIDMPPILKEDKFTISSERGAHLGFGNYVTEYTYKANRATTVQRYYGNNKTMYASNEAEAAELKKIIFF